MKPDFHGFADAPKEHSFLTRVRQALPELHPAERRVSDFVCDFPGEFASYSAQELAALAHVSKATVSRFIQRLGYQNYEKARRHARLEKQTGSRLFLSGAQAILLGSGGLTGLAAKLERHFSIPVIDGVAAAIKMAEGLAHLRMPPDQQQPD